MNPSTKVQLPVRNVYFTRIENLKPCEQALMQNAEWYLANQDVTFLPGVHLFTRDLVVTAQMKQKLSTIVGDTGVVLVGDLENTGAQNGCRIEREHINEIIQHMTREQSLLKAQKIVMKEQRYPLLLTNPQIFKPDEVKGTPKSYSAHTDIRIKLVFDGTIPSVFTDPLHPRRNMARAIEIADELRFQQRYFFRRDDARFVCFAEDAHEIPVELISRPDSWIVKREKRNTAQCLEQCLGSAESQGVAKRYQHVYLFTSGPASDGVCDTARKMRQQGIGLTQFVVGNEWQKALYGRAQLLQTAQDAGGDIYFVPPQRTPLLPLFLKEHLERYRANQTTG